MNDIPMNARAAAAILMDETGNDVQAAKVLARTVLNEPKYAELRELLWHTAIDLEIDQLWRSGRDVRKQEILHGPVMSVARTARTSRPLARGEVSVPNLGMTEAIGRRVAGLLHFEMPDGTHLADWTKANLLDHGRRVMANGRSTVRTGSFFISVAEMLPKDSSRVGEVLSEADLERVYRQQALVPA